MPSPLFLFYFKLTPSLISLLLSSSPPSLFFRSSPSALRSFNQGLQTIDTCDCVNPASHVWNQSRAALCPGVMMIFIEGFWGFLMEWDKHISWSTDWLTRHLMRLQVRKHLSSDLHQRWSGDDDCCAPPSQYGWIVWAWTVFTVEICAENWQ